jgi:hypothetical protein
MKNLIVLATAALLLTTGCIKQISEQNGPLGIESNPDVVQKAVDAATAPISLANAKPNQSVTYEENYNVRSNGSGPVVMTKRYVHRLMGISQDATTITFAIFEDFWSYFTSGAVRDEDHRELDLKFSKSNLILGPSIASQVSMVLAKNFDKFIHPHSNTALF